MDRTEETPHTTTLFDRLADIEQRLNSTLHALGRAYGNLTGLALDSSPVSADTSVTGCLDRLAEKVAWAMTTADAIDLIVGTSNDKAAIAAREERVDSLGR